MMEAMTPQIEVDVLIATDLRFPGGNNASVVEEITAHGRAGYTTALLHLPSPVQRSERDFAPRIRSLIEEGDARLVLGGSVRARLLVVRHPTVLMELAADLPKIDVDHVVIVANQVPVDDRARSPYYNVVSCDHAATALTGKRAHWAPIGPQVRATLVPFAGDIALREANWNNIIDVDSWYVRRSGFLAEPPVIGRHSRGDWSKWPADRDTITSIYPVDGSYTVKILGGTEAPAEVLGGLPAAWIDLPFNSLPPRQFLSEIDFLVYYHHPGLIEAFGRTVLEGVAAGAVAVIDPRFEETFGPAAIYATPAQVRETLDRFRRDPGSFIGQSERGVAYVRENFSYDTHVERIRQLIGEPGADQEIVAAVAAPTKNAATSTNLVESTRVIVDLLGEFDAWDQVTGPAIALTPDGVDVPDQIAQETIPDYLAATPELIHRYVRARAAGLSRIFGDAAVLDVNGRVRGLAGRAHHDLIRVDNDRESNAIGRWALSLRPDSGGGRRPNTMSRVAVMLRQEAPQWFLKLASAGKSAPRKMRRRIIDALAPAGAVLVKQGTIPRFVSPRQGFALFYATDGGDAEHVCRLIAERAAMSNSFAPALLAPANWATAAAIYRIPFETLLTESEVDALGGSWAEYRRMRIADSIEVFQPISAVSLGARGSLDNVITALDIAENLGSRRSEKEG